MEAIWKILLQTYDGYCRIMAKRRERSFIILSIDLGKGDNLRIRNRVHRILVSLMALLILSSVLAVPSSVYAASTASSGSVEVKTLASGSKYATELYVIESGKPGPVVLIVGGVHGNETAGYKAALQMCKVRPEIGTLLVIPEANKLAIAAKKRVAKGQADLNRAFPSTKSGNASGTLAKSILQVIKEYNVDWVMDMHEGYNYTKDPSSSSVGQSLIYYPDSDTKTIAASIVSLLNKNISSSLKKFSLLRYPVKGSIARAAAVTVGANSFIFETCTKETLSKRVDKQLTAANKLLSYLNMQ